MTDELTIDENHRLQGPGVEHHNSPNVTKGRRGVIQPEIGVVHWTGGDRFGPVKNTFLNPRGGASAHFVIERDGTINQFAPTNRRAWHAGKSSWAGRRNLNNYSIGVELVNAGLLLQVGNKYYTRGRNKREIDWQDVQWVNERPFHAYSREQCIALRQIMRALWLHYNIKQWAGHSDVSPGRKSDPGPILSLAELDTMFGRAIATRPTKHVIQPVISVFPDWMRSLFSLFDPKETR